MYLQTKYSKTYFVNYILIHYCTKRVDQFSYCKLVYFSFVCENSTQDLVCCWLWCNEAWTCRTLDLLEYKKKFLDIIIKILNLASEYMFEQAST